MEGIRVRGRWGTESCKNLHICGRRGRWELRRYWIKGGCGNEITRKPLGNDASSFLCCVLRSVAACGFMGTDELRGGQRGAGFWSSEDDERGRSDPEVWSGRGGNQGGAASLHLYARRVSADAQRTERDGRISRSDHGFLRRERQAPGAGDVRGAAFVARSSIDAGRHGRYSRLHAAD